MKKTSCLSLSLTFAFALTAMLGMASNALAQSSGGSGNIQGTVLDPSGALIPQAQITVSNADGFSHTYESDSAGGFDVSQLSPGSYSVSVSATGFTPTLESVQVTGDEITHEDIKLGISVNQEIEVYAN